MFGRDFFPLSDTGIQCSILTYNNTYTVTNRVIIFTDATAWNLESSGETYILVFNEVLLICDTIDHY